MSGEKCYWCGDTGVIIRTGIFPGGVYGTSCRTTAYTGERCLCIVGVRLGHQERLENASVKLKEFISGTTQGEHGSEISEYLTEWDLRQLLATVKKEFPYIYDFAAKELASRKEELSKLPPATYCGSVPKRGVAIFLITGSGRVAVSLRRSTFYYPNKWQTPGGTLEVGETPEQAVLRELEEESGVILGCEDIYKIDQTLELYTTGEPFEMTWFFSKASEDLRLVNKEPDKHGDWRWMDAIAVRDMEKRGNHTPRLPELYKKALALATRGDR